MGKKLYWLIMGILSALTLFMFLAFLVSAFQVVQFRDIFSVIVVLALLQGVPYVIRRIQDRPNPAGVITGSIFMAGTLIVNAFDPSYSTIEAQFAVGLMYMWSWHLIFPHKDNAAVRLAAAVTAPPFIALFMTVFALNAGLQVIVGMVIAFILAIVGLMTIGGIFLYIAKIYDRVIDRLITRHFGEKQKRKNDDLPVKRLELSEDEPQPDALQDENESAYAASR